MHIIEFISYSDLWPRCRRRNCWARLRVPVVRHTTSEQGAGGGLMHLSISPASRRQVAPVGGVGDADATSDEGAQPALARPDPGNFLRWRKERARHLSNKVVGENG